MDKEVKFASDLAFGLANLFMVLYSVFYPVEDPALKPVLPILSSVGILFLFFVYARKKGFEAAGALKAFVGILSGGIGLTVIGVIQHSVNSGGLLVPFVYGWLLVIFGAVYFVLYAPVLVKVSRERKT